MNTLAKILWIEHIHISNSSSIVIARAKYFLLGDSEKQRTMDELGFIVVLETSLQFRWAKGNGWTPSRSSWTMRPMYELGFTYVCKTSHVQFRWAKGSNWTPSLSNSEPMFYLWPKLPQLQVLFKIIRRDRVVLPQLGQWHYLPSNTLLRTQTSLTRTKAHVQHVMLNTCHEVIGLMPIH